METKKPKYRVGRKQGRAILEVETGYVYLLFEEGKEEHAKAYCYYLNNKENFLKDIDVNELANEYCSKTPEIYKKAQFDGYVSGYNRAISDNINKWFTFEQMTQCYVDAVNNVGLMLRSFKTKFTKAEDYVKSIMNK